MARYVILHHGLSDAEHWDLMIEHEEQLATWQVMQNPTELRPRGNNSQAPARKITDHRRAYLTYEGPVSGGRGHVRRVDEGSADVLLREPQCWIVRLTGQYLQGVYALPVEASGLVRWLGDKYSPPTEAAARS